MGYVSQYFRVRIEFLQTQCFQIYPYSLTVQCELFSFENFFDLVFVHIDVQRSCRTMLGFVGANALLPESSWICRLHPLIPLER